MLILLETTDLFSFKLSWLDDVAQISVFETYELFFVMLIMLGHIYQFIILMSSCETVCIFYMVVNAIGHIFGFFELNMEHYIDYNYQL